MSQAPRPTGRHEYNKPQLKERIEEAMQRFLSGGKAVQKLPAAAPPEANPEALRLAEEQPLPLDEDVT